MPDVPHLATLEELARLVREHPRACVRFSQGPDADREESSRDSESGLDLPGLSVNPLHPEAWWTRPVEDWLARQLCQYAHLGDQDDDRIAWVLEGDEVARGPDCEPLLADVRPLAVVSDPLLKEARRRYEERFDAGQGPTDS